MFNSIKYIVNKIGLIRKINNLEFKYAGIDDEGMPFVELNSGLKIFGTKTRAKDKKYYNLLAKKKKDRLPFDCFNLANDIIIRYIEGGLKYGGPRKELFYKVKRGDYIAEMGAYMGHYTLYLSEKVGNEGKVIAIEPLPDNLKILKKNIEANGINNVTIVPKGVWKEKKELVFSRKKGDTQSGSIDLNYSDEDQFIIQADTLDNILKESQTDHINFMLLQLNGAEPEALQGLNKILPGNFAIAARYNTRKQNAALQIKDILEKRNYKVKTVDKEYVFAELK